MHRVNKTIAVILVNYNGLAVNDACITSILHSETTANVRIIVVDNASEDGSVESIRKNFGDHVRILEAGYNSGFSHANNIGIDFALANGADYVMLLNNDTVIEADAIELLLEAADKKGDSLCVPRIMYFNRPSRIWFGGGYVSRYTFNTKHIDEGREYVDSPPVIRKTEFASGCCMLIPRKIINEVGKLDESYFLYYEDADYCARINEAGFSIYYVSGAVVYHKVSFSAGGKISRNGIYYTTRNRLYYVNKFFKRGKIFFYPYFIVNRTCYCISWLIGGKRDLVGICIKAIIDYFKNVTGSTEL